jgi:luciferase family oxidoreductase group 1
VSAPPRFSLLDFNHVGTAVDLMGAADDLGYHRFWLGEHHSPWQCANPLLLGALLGAASNGIRLGCGGVCLSYQSPYRVAADARLIEYMLPGRFDLGVTRGLPVDPKVLDALLDGRPAGTLRDHYEKLEDLHAYLTGRLPAEHPLHGRRLPLEPGPPLWVLGLSAETARWAGRHGAGFCFSLHHAQPDPERKAPAVLAEYRRSFVPSPEFPQPEAIVVASLNCAADPEAARAAEQSFAELRHEAEAEGSLVVQPNLAGTTADCAARLRELAESLAAEMMVLLPWPPELDRRIAVLHELAAELGLEPRPRGGAAATGAAE